jgi:hypothetical protein
VSGGRRQCVRACACVSVCVCVCEMVCTCVVVCLCVWVCPRAGTHAHACLILWSLLAPVCMLDSVLPILPISSLVLQMKVTTFL